MFSIEFGSSYESSGGNGGGKQGPFQKFGNMMSGMAKGGLDFLTSIPMKITNIIGAKVRFIQGIGQAKMQFLGSIGNKFSKFMGGLGGGLKGGGGNNRPSQGYGTPSTGYGTPATSKPSYDNSAGDSYGAPQGPVQERFSTDILRGHT